MSNETNKIIALAFTTLDGVVEDPDGSWGTPFGGWGFRQGPQAFAGDKFRLGPILDTGALLFGRGTWQLFSQRWPTRTDDFASAMNRIPKYVASHTLESVDSWSNSILLRTELSGAVERLRAERDVVVVGSTSVVHQLAASDLVDEYRLFVFPTVLGAGERLFERTTPAELRIVSADVSGPNVLLRYDVLHPAPSERLAR
jgi:dihydrofolate reductase